MKKVLCAIVAALLIFGNTSAFAGKSYSSGGGRSYSSGSSRSFSSGSRSSGFSSGSKSSSFSSSKSSSGSKSYSSSSSKSYSSGKGFSFSSGSSSTHQSTGPPKGYSSGNKGYTSSGSSYSRKPTGNFQSLAATEQRKAESRINYQRATAPKETYTTPKGNKVTIKKDDARVVNIRKMPEEKWINREDRVKVFYHDYYAHPPTTVVHYNDPYSTFFWMWMLNQSLDTRASWAYNHRYDMDDARYRDLLAKDKGLEVRVRQLEAEKKARDPNYVPPGVDEDLQYTDEFVNASVNPEPKPYTGITFGGFFHGLWVFIKWCFYIALTIALICTVVWLVFYKRW